MNEYQSVLERAGSNFAPLDLELESILRRRDRKRRNQRIAAGVVGIAVFVAAVWIVTSVGSFDRTQTPAVTGPAETGPTETVPTETGPIELWPTSPGWRVTRVTKEDLAVGDSFMEAWVGGDGEAAAAMLSPEGTFDGFSPGVLPALHDWFRAGGWTFGSSDCYPHSEAPQLAVVVCHLTYENDLTRALETASLEMVPSSPPGGLGFNIDGGKIKAVTTIVHESYVASTHPSVGYDDFADNMFRSPNPARDDTFGAVWDVFIEWLSTSHPEDFVRMYDQGRDYPILDPTSIELWERYTDEFVASPQAMASASEAWEALSRSNAGLSADQSEWTVTGMGHRWHELPPEGAIPSEPESGTLIASHSVIHSGFVYVYADGRVISMEDMTSFVYERRLSPAGVELVRSGALEAGDFLVDWADQVPEAAWADLEIRPYVPSRYAFCYYQGLPDSELANSGYEYPSRVLGFFPAPARAILHGELTYGVVGPVGEDLSSPECSAVTPEEARALGEILAGVRVKDSEGDEVYWEVTMVLPHGRRIIWGG